jgi:hypothetical protein
MFKIIGLTLASTAFALRGTVPMAVGDGGNVHLFDPSPEHVRHLNARRLVDATGATFSVNGKFYVKEATTIGGNFDIAGDKFTVASGTGNTKVKGTLGAGASTLASAVVTNKLTAGSLESVGTVDLGTKAADASCSDAGKTDEPTCTAAGATWTAAVTNQAVTVKGTLGAGASTLASAVVTNKLTAGSLESVGTVDLGTKKITGSDGSIVTPGQDVTVNGNFKVNGDSVAKKLTAVGVVDLGTKAADASCSDASKTDEPTCTAAGATWTAAVADQAVNVKGTFNVGDDSIMSGDLDVQGTFTTGTLGHINSITATDITIEDDLILSGSRTDTNAATDTPSIFHSQIPSFYDDRIFQFKATDADHAKHRFFDASCSDASKTDETACAAAGATWTAAQTYKTIDDTAVATGTADTVIDATLGERIKTMKPAFNYRTVTGSEYIRRAQLVNVAYLEDHGRDELLFAIKVLYNTFGLNLDDVLNAYSDEKGGATHTSAQKAKSSAYKFGKASVGEACAGVPAAGKCGAGCVADAMGGCETGFSDE